MTDDAPRDEVDPGPAEATPADTQDAADVQDAGAAAPDVQPPIELTEAALEALLFVAERPLSRREIAALAGTEREVVDARLGDLEVSLRGRGVDVLA